MHPTQPNSDPVPQGNVYIEYNGIEYEATPVGWVSDQDGWKLAVSFDYCDPVTGHMSQHADAMVFPVDQVWLDPDFAPAA